MRQIITDYGDLGHPFNIQDYGHMQQGFQEVVNAIMQSLATNPTDIIILTGCSVTINTTNTFTTAGWIYYNGQIIQVNAHNIVGTNLSALNWYLDITEFDPLYVTYGDGSQKQVHSIPLLKMTYGSGDFANSSLVSYNARNSFVSQQYGGTPDSNGFYSLNSITNPGLYNIDYTQTNLSNVNNPYISQWPDLLTIYNEPIGNTETLLPNKAKFFGNIKVTQTNSTLNPNFTYPIGVNTPIVALEQELNIFNIVNYTSFDNKYNFTSNGTSISQPVINTTNTLPVSAIQSNSIFKPLTFKRYYLPFITAYNGPFTMGWTGWWNIY